jgi:hypothetical protein
MTLTAGSAAAVIRCSRYLRGNAVSWHHVMPLPNGGIVDSIINVEEWQTAFGWRAKLDNGEYKENENSIGRGCDDGR